MSVGEQVVWAAGEAAVPGTVQVQEHAALPVLLVVEQMTLTACVLCLILPSVFLLPAKPRDPYEDQTIRAGTGVFGEERA